MNAYEEALSKIDATPLEDCRKAIGDDVSKCHDPAFLLLDRKARELAQIEQLQLQTLSPLLPAGQVSSWLHQIVCETDWLEKARTELQKDWFLLQEGTP